MITIINIFKTLGFIALSSILIMSCQSDKKQNETGSSSKNTSLEHKIQSVEVVKPEPRSFTAEVLITGTAEPNQKVILYAMESGYVQTMSKNIGDIVKKGEVIVELKNPELSRQYQN